MKGILEKCFHLEALHTNVRTEFFAGMTTFFTMVYLVLVNPAILSQTGMEDQAVMISTSLVAVVGTLFVAFFSNLPYAIAPGMGVNALFAFTICGSMGYSWQQGLVILLLAGVLFTVIAATRLRAVLIRAIPDNLKPAITAGIGLFIAMTGLMNAGLIEPDSQNGLALGELLSPSVGVMLLGLAIVVALMIRKSNLAMLVGILVATVVALCTGVADLPSQLVAAPMAVEKVWFHLDFAGLFESLESVEGFFCFLLALVSIILVCFFSSVGMLLGSAGKEDSLAPERIQKKTGEIMVANGAAFCFSSLMGNSPPMVLAESNTGIAQGGRTGLTGVFISAGFILAIFFAPLFSIVPACATAPALIIIGVLMASGLSGVSFAKLEDAIPAFFTTFGMLFTYSIVDGIAFGFISYCFCKTISGQIKQIHWIMWVVSGLFLLEFLFI